MMIEEYGDDQSMHPEFDERLWKEVIGPNRHGNYYGQGSIGTSTSSEGSDMASGATSMQDMEDQLVDKVTKQVSEQLANDLENRIVDRVSKQVSEQLVKLAKTIERKIEKKLDRKTKKKIERKQFRKAMKQSLSARNLQMSETPILSETDANSSDDSSDDSSI